MFELSVTVSDEESSYTQKFLVYNEGITLSHTDPELSGMVQDTIKKFVGTPDDVVVKIKFTW